MSHLLCPRCDSKHVRIARDMKASRRCTDCFHTWEPLEDLRKPSSSEKEKQYREEFEVTNWEMETDFIDVYLAACKKREEEIEILKFERVPVEIHNEEIKSWKTSVDRLVTVNGIKDREITQLKKRLDETEKELYQQRFNNKHNLSIDQKVSDEIASLKKQLEDAYKLVGQNAKLHEENIEHLRQQLESYQGSCGMHTIDEIAKLKELIKQAVPFVKGERNYNLIQRWLKDVEELWQSEG